MTARANGALRDLCIAFNGGPASVSALHYAVGLASATGAHLTGLLAHGTSSVSRNIPAWLPEETRRSVLDALAHRADEVRARFDEVVRDRLDPARTHWIEIGGDPDATVADYAGLYDLTVLGQYENLPAAAEVELHPGTVARRTARPIVVVPRSCEAAPDAPTVALAWDGHRVATRAGVAALPLLDHAAGVRIVEFLDGLGGDPPPGLDLPALLQRHGIAFAHDRFPAEPATVAAGILRYCEANAVDLLVLGATRRDHAPPAGVEAQVLDRTRIPVLLAN
jgi:nucleotide-binding universal stress UspA family protein